MGKFQDQVKAMHALTEAAAAAAQVAPAVVAPAKAEKAEKPVVKDEKESK